MVAYASAATWLSLYRPANLKSDAPACMHPSATIRDYLRGCAAAWVTKCAHAGKLAQCGNLIEARRQPPTPRAAAATTRAQSFKTLNHHPRGLVVKASSFYACSSVELQTTRGSRVRIPPGVGFGTKGSMRRRICWIRGFWTPFITFIVRVECGPRVIKRFSTRRMRTMSKRALNANRAATQECDGARATPFDVTTSVGPGSCSHTKVMSETTDTTPKAVRYPCPPSRRSESVGDGEPGPVTGAG